MCWSGEASLAIAAVGVAATAYCVKKEVPKPLIAGFFYFVLMEMLQAASYLVVDECMNPNNTFLTYLAYIHISLQPLVINMMALQFIPESTRKRIQWWIYGIAACLSVAIIIRILPLNWKMYCYNVLYYVPFFQELTYKIPFCGKHACTVSGEWHLAWEMKAGYNWVLDRAYFVGVFILPFLYGSWKVALWCAIVGPGLTLWLTDNANEFGAVWCMFSIGVLIVIIVSPIRERMMVKSWYGLKKWAD